MAWTSPRTWVANAVLTAAQLNTDVRDNLNETAPAKATTAGSLFAATGTNSIAERTPERDFVTTEESTASTSFTDLATSGPAVTVTTGVHAIIFLAARLSNDTGGHFAEMSFEVSGASSIGANVSRALMYESPNADDKMTAGIAIFRDDLTAGSNTFTAKYRALSNTATFQYRRLDVIPL